MKKEDNKVLKRILFLFIFVFVSASIFLLRPNTLTKLQGNASSYNQNESKYEETGVVITTDYLIESLSGTGTLSIYNGSNSDIKITNFISKKINKNNSNEERNINYIKTSVNEYVTSKTDYLLRFDRTCLGDTYSSTGCSSTNDVLKLDNTNIEYKNLVVGIEYELNGEKYYLASTAFYLDTSKLNNIVSIRNTDNSKSSSVSVMNLFLNDANRLETEVLMEDASHKYNNIDLTEKVGRLVSNIEKPEDVSTLFHSFKHDKYFFADYNETPENTTFDFVVNYKVGGYKEEYKDYNFKYYDKFIISEPTSQEEEITTEKFDSLNSYVPTIELFSKINYYNRYKFDSFKEAPLKASEFSYNYKLDSKLGNYELDNVFLARKEINHFIKRSNSQLDVVHSPVIVTIYNKNDLANAIISGLEKLRKAKEDSIDINSYQDYVDIFLTALDLYTSRYNFDVNGKDVIVNNSSIYQMTKILNDYKFKEVKKADYTELNKRVKLACDALSKFDSVKDSNVSDGVISNICSNIMGQKVTIKSVDSSTANYITNANELRRLIGTMDWDLSVNFQAYLETKSIEIENHLKAFPVYTEEYMNIYNSAKTENPMIKTVKFKSDLNVDGYLEEKFISLVNKMNEEHIKITLDDLIKYIFNEYSYEDLYEDGPDETLYSSDVWQVYYNELSKYYTDENDYPKFYGMNFLDNQAEINASVESLRQAINVLATSERLTDNSFAEDYVDGDVDEYLYEMSSLLSKEIFPKYSNKIRTIMKPLPLNGTSLYNGKEVNNQVYIYNNYLDAIIYMMYDMMFNINYDALFKDGRNSRKELGYLSIEEYYDFFYNFNIDDYELSSIEEMVSKPEFGRLIENADIKVGETSFEESFYEWYVRVNFVKTGRKNYFTERQSSIYSIQEIFKYLKSILIPKVGDYSDICNYYKVLTTINLDYYTPETKEDIVNALWQINWSYKKDEQDKIDEQAKKLKEFIDGLTMRKADTSKLYLVYNEALKYDKTLYSNYYELQDAMAGFKYLNDVYIDRQSDVDALAKKIYNSINNLVLKKADYTNIDYIKAKIALLEKEKYENYYVLEKALDDVVYGLDITKQSEVDTMYNNILKAYTSLKINGNLPANYDDFKKEIEKVPIFVKDYDPKTQEKINQLKKEIEEFPKDLKLKDQTRIDNMISKIKKIMNEINGNYASKLETVTPVDTSLIKSVKINGDAIDISRMPFDFSVGYTDTFAEIEVEVVKNAKVFVYGGTALFYGENNITIQVIYLDKIYNYELNVYRKSSSNYLKDLKIHTKGASFNSENFNKEKQDYIVKINNDVTRLDIEAIPEEETARINIKNNYKLKDDSRIQIEVTSRDGSFRVYTLVIKKTSVVNYKVLIILAVIFALLAVALKGLQNISKKKTENE